MISENLQHNHEAQMEKITKAHGFIAALDQSGGSTPKALKIYGIKEDTYSKGEESMYKAIHDMRTRIITSPVFGGDRVIASIIFEDTMDREIEGKATATFLWEEKEIVPFLKVDKGLADEKNGVQMMKPICNLEELLKRAVTKGIFGTKMRSLIKLADKDGIKAIVDQQFEIAKRIISAGLVPIIEPEVDIHSLEKGVAEIILKECILAHLNSLKDNQKVMLKLTLPNDDNFYKDCMKHPNCLRVAALSGGYSQDVANHILSRNKGMIASFSRALTEGLRSTQTKEEFDVTLDNAIESIFEASITM